MEVLGDTGHVESRFCPFRDGVCVGAGQVHGLRQTYHRLRKLFWMLPMVLLCDEAQVIACFGPLGDIADADRCTVCAKRTIGLEIIVDAPDATPR